MYLYQIQKSTKIKDAAGVEFPALTVFAEALKYIKDIAISRLQQTIGRAVILSDIQWVVTVPAIWQDSAKHFMRRAAQQAGLFDVDESQLILALEPASAALYCQNEVNEAKKTGRNVVVDCGGGTVDITVHTTQENDYMIEECAPQGGPWGSTMIDAKFRALLDEVFQKEKMEQFQKNYPSAYLDMIDKFEICKLNYPKTEKSFITLSKPFLEFMAQELGALTKQAKGKLEYISHDGNLMIPGKTMLGLLQPVVNDIVEHLKKMPEILTCDTMYLVGGFAANDILRSHIEKAFAGVPTLKIIRPSFPALAVMSGAVRYGMNPAVVTYRFMPYTYGIQVSNPWHSRHAADGCSKVTSIAHGVAHDTCQQVFLKVVQMGDQVKVGHEWREILTSVFDDQTAIYVGIHTIKDKTVPQYTTAPGCRLHVGVSIPIPKQVGRPVEVIVKFGGTELDLQVIDVETKHKVSKTVLFY